MSILQSPFDIAVLTLAAPISPSVLLAVLPGQHVPQCRTPLQESVEALSRAFGSEAVSLVLDRVDALWLRLLCISAAEAAFGAFFIIDRKRMVMPDAKHWLDAATAAQLELGGGAADGDSSSKHFFEASALLDPNRPLLLWALRHVLACRRIDIDRQQRRRTTSLEVTQALCLQLESIARESFSALASPTAAPTPKLRRSYFSTASADTSVLSAPTNQSASCLQSGADACQTLLDAAASGAHQAPNPTEKQAASSAKAAPSAHRDIQLRAMIAAAVLDKAAAHVKAQDGLTSDPDAVQGPDQHQASETDADTLLRNAVRRLHLAVAAYPLVLDRLSAHQWSAYKAEAEASFGLVGAGATVAPGGRCNETATSAGGSSSSLQEAHEQHVEHPSTSDCRYVDQEYSVDMKLEPSQAAVSGSDAELLEAAMEEAADRMHELTGCCSVADRDGTADEHASDRDREEFRARLRHAPIAPPKHDDAFERVWARGRRWMDDAEAGWHVATDEADLMACMTFSALAKRTGMVVLHSISSRTIILMVHI